MSNFGAVDDGSNNSNVGKVGKVSNISAIGNGSDKGNVGNVGWILLLAMLYNIGDLHVVDRKIFTLARKNHSLCNFCCFINQTGRCLVANYKLTA